MLINALEIQPYTMLNIQAHVTFRLLSRYQWIMCLLFTNFLRKIAMNQIPRHINASKSVPSVERVVYFSPVLVIGFRDQVKEDE